MTAFRLKKAHSLTSPSARVCMSSVSGILIRHQWSGRKTQDVFLPRVKGAVNTVEKSTISDFSQVHVYCIILRLVDSCLLNSLNCCKPLLEGRALQAGFNHLRSMLQVRLRTEGLKSEQENCRCIDVMKIKIHWLHYSRHVPLLIWCLPPRTRSPWPALWVIRRGSVKPFTHNYCLSA
jgi:hypothetical protein